MTGSTRWDDAGHPLSYAENSTGNLFWNGGCYYDQNFEYDGRWYGCADETGSWSRSVRGRTLGIGGRTLLSEKGRDCSGTSCRVWQYVLLFEEPSRLAIIKNAMGDAVNIVEDYVPPPFYNGVAAATGAASWTRANAPGAPFLGDWGTVPKYATVAVYKYDPAQQSAVKFWVYTIDYGTNTSGVTQRKADPGAPLAVWQAAPTNHRPAINAAGTGCALAGSWCKYVKARDVIGQNANRVNWGLLPYSSNNQNLGVGKVGVIDVNSNGTNPGLANIKNAYRLNLRQAWGAEPNTYGPALTVSDGHALGLIAKGGTNTRAALYKADADTDTVKGANNSLTRTHAGADQCPRPYGVILVTDGQSNVGNPGDATWDPCYNDAASYPAGSAHALYNLFNRDPKVNTWAIGISPSVGACELNFTSYAGRTDASSPRGDAGFSGYAAAVPGDPGNPYVAEPTADVSQLDTFDNHYNTAHGHNAFFPTDSAALSNAISSIVNATATGDYSTNAPVSGMSASAEAASHVYLPSTEFPSWKGHIYAYDLSKYEVDEDTGEKTWTKRPGYEEYPHWLLWDAGLALNATDASARKIFTWNPSTKALVEVRADTAAQLTAVQAVGGASVTAAVVDFIRGNDGSGTARPWRLGPLINSAPALVAAPGIWLQGNTAAHGMFESTYKDRAGLLWVGSNDGLLHAFRIKDGKEQIALLPPSLFAQQVALYNAYVADARNPKGPSGQLADPARHLYGVANSFRFGDVWNGATYRTFGVITLGPGGSEVAAIDVTDVPAPEPPDPPDPTYVYPANPVTVVWTHNPTTLTGLGQTWSIPAMAPVADGRTWRLLMGSGYKPAGTAALQTSDLAGYPKPRVFSLDPTNGSLLSSDELSTTNTQPPFVGNQAFADTVLLNPDSRFYQDDNISRLGLQADLNGRIHFLTSNNASQAKFDTSIVGIDASAKVGQSQPIYYNPAASGYGKGTNAGCVAYAFGSGTLYERSAAVTGASSTFVPTLYVATAQKVNWDDALGVGQISPKVVAGTWTVENDDGTTGTATLRGKTQLTGPPFMLVPRSGVGQSKALFLLYDPEAGCYGRSYVAQIAFEGSETCTPTNTAYKAFDAGEGAASGFTIAGTKVLVSKSGIGQGQKASLFEPPGVAASVGGIPEPKVKWWKELK